MNCKNQIRNRIAKILFFLAVSGLFLGLFIVAKVKVHSISTVTALLSQPVGELPSCTLNQDRRVYLPLINSSEKSDSKSNTPNNTDLICANILSPTEGLVLQSETGVITITGVVRSFIPEIQVKLDSADGNVDLAGNFNISDQILSDGENLLTVKFYQSGTLIGTKSVRVIWNAPAEASTQITLESGGTVEVTNASSEIFGAAVVIPPGAAERSFRAIIIADPEELYNLPYGFVAVGPPVVFQPIGETFFRPVTVKLPINRSLLPADTKVDNVTIHAITDNGWSVLPVTARGSDFVQTQVSNFAFGYFVASIFLPIKKGEVRISTNPSYATLYIDGFNTRLRTPATLYDIKPGDHALKFYLQGFNEVSHTVNISTDGGAFIDLELGMPVEPIPVVNLDHTIQDGLEVFDNVFTISGTVTYNGEGITSGVAIVSLNGDDSFINITDGGFTNKLSLLPGENQLEVRVTGPNGSTGVSRKVKIVNKENSLVTTSSHTNTSADKGITVILTWDKNDTDLDLHLFDPKNNHAWYEDLTGIPNAQLDVDDIDGYGPETFTMLNPISGTYKINIDYFGFDVESNPNPGPVTASLKIFVGKKLRFSGSYTFTAPDYDNTNGLGDNSPSFWKAYELTIGALEIVSIKTQTESPQDEAIFTTHPDENLITVKLNAPDNVLDKDIHFEIKEVEENFVLDTSGFNVVNRTLEFKAKHKKLEGLTNPRYSHPLTYQIIAYTLDTNGQRDLESPPEMLIQDTRSRIRQEYIDKKELRPDFIRETPRYDTIIDAGHYPTGSTFSFADFAKGSDFSPDLAVIRESRNIAESLKTAWTLPLRVTSGWRNPRNNDAEPDSKINSFHQTGDAVDLNPSWEKKDWPAGVSTYRAAQRALFNLAKKTFASGNCTILLHGGNPHVHIQCNSGVLLLSENYSR